MSGRDEGYYGPAPGDLSKGCLLPAFALVGVLLMAALCAMGFRDEAGEAYVPDGPASASSGLAIDVTDRWAMHDAGLPTKDDVLNWHMCGRWGFSVVRDGEQQVCIWDELPGGAWVWDALYGLEDERAAFRF